MNSDNGFPSDLITLNVGGIRYQTTRTTIHKHQETMLSALLRNTSEDTREIFIDHDGDLFRWILLWYRTGALEPCEFVGWDATLAFYGIEREEEERSKAVKEFVDFLAREQWRTCLIFLVKNRYLDLKEIPSVALNFRFEWFMQNRDEIDRVLNAHSLCIDTVECGYCDLTHISGFPACRIVSEYGKIDYNIFVMIRLRKIQ